MRDTIEALQRELLALKNAYLRGPMSEERDRGFAQREAELGERFRRLGAAPSYPQVIREAASQ